MDETRDGCRSPPGPGRAVAASPCLARRCTLAALAAPAWAQDKPPPLSPRAQAADANGNGVIDRDEAGGPLAANFDEMDCDKSNSLDGGEIRAFFTGAGCKSIAAAPGGSAPPQAGTAPPPLSERAKAADANGNGVIDRDEARGPLAANFDEMDCNKSNSLDGGEIRAFFTGAGCKSIAAAAKPATPAASPRTGQRGPPRGGGRPPATVTLDDVIAEPLAKTVPVIGRLVARQSGVVASQVRGAVMEVRVDVGDRVERGQIVAVLVGGRMKAARDRAAASVARFRGLVAAAEAEYRKKRGELRRLDRLRKSAAFSRARYEDLERDVQARQRRAGGSPRPASGGPGARLRQAELDLADTRIEAPFPGVVTQKAHRHRHLSQCRGAGGQHPQRHRSGGRGRGALRTGCDGLSTRARWSRLTLDDGSRHQDDGPRHRPDREREDAHPPGALHRRFRQDRDAARGRPERDRADPGRRRAGQVATVHKDAVVRSGTRRLRVRGGGQPRAAGQGPSRRRHSARASSCSTA